jgi:hypothetical protein
MGDKETTAGRAVAQRETAMGTQRVKEVVRAGRQSEKEGTLLKFS